MQALHNFYAKLSKPRRHVVLVQALLGANIAYLGYRFRYFLLNNALETCLHLFEFYLLGMFFNTQQFFGLILLRAAIVIIKNGWWGALEGLRERMRRYKRAIHEMEMAQELACWLYLASFIAGIVFIIGMIWLCSLLQFAQGASDERLMWYGLAMLLQLIAEIIVRVIHSGIFATQRVYRPVWSIFFAEIVGFVTIMSLLPFARSWCLPASYILTSGISLYFTWHFSCAAYRLHCRTIVIPVTWPKFIIWLKQLPARNICLAALAGATMGLEGLLLWLLRPLTKDNPDLFKLIYLLSPQISAGFSWARMCYFDFKKLSSSNWELFVKRFSRYFLKFSVVVGIMCWLISLITCHLFLPEISLLVLLGFLPLFIGCSMLALRQIQLFARHHYADVLLSTAFLGFIIVCATFFKPEVTLLLTFAAVYITLLMTTRLHFPITPIFPIVNFTPIYLHLNAIKACENQIAVLYFEITSKINPQHKKELLENISFAIGQDKLSRLNNNSFLCSITLQSTLEKIKKILPGQIEYFYSSHWQADGLTALNKVYVLKKRLLNFNENLIITPQTIEQDFITEFPSAKIVSLEKSKDIAIYFKTIRKNKEACRQIVSAVNKAWIGLPSPVIVNKYVAFCYWNEDKPLMFVLQSSKETQRRIQYWQRQAWQLTITQLTPK